MLTLDSLAAAAPDGRALFDGLSLSAGRERVGLVGRNGSGKSTLIAIIAGDVAPASGTVSRDGRIGRLEQVQPTAQPLAETLGVADALARLDRLEMGEGTAEDAAEADWTLPARIEEALRDAGMAGLDLSRPAASLSGGERTKVGIARLLLDAPDILLLDEPTNNLDAEARAAVARLLVGWKDAAIVASHDRDLLEQMDRIVHLSPVGVTIHGGGWSAFEEARDADRERAEAGLERADLTARQQKRDTQRQVERKARRDGAGRAERLRGSQGKLLMDARKNRAERTTGRDSNIASRLAGQAEDDLAAARARVEIVAPLSMSLPETGLPANRTLLSFDAVTLAIGGRMLFGPLSFAIEGPERVAVEGPNGAGKTSLMKLVTGEIAPTSGRVVRQGSGVAMLDQHVELLDPALTLVENLRRHHPSVGANAAYATLARFAFRNRDAERLAGSLSGGERLRAGLAVTFGGAEPPQLLLLDEPTNHLDLDSLEALEVALREFDGALLVVSHDERFLEEIGAQRRIRLG